MIRKITQPAMLGLAALSLAALARPAAAQDAAGDWLAPLEVTPGNRVPLLIHIKRDEAGVFGGTMDSPLQGVVGLTLAGIAAEAGSLSFSVPAVGGSYKGQWDASAKLWKGEWTQNGKTWPLVLILPPPPQPLPADWQAPPDAEIARLIADRNVGRPGQGIVVGVLDPAGQRVVAGGTGAGARFDRHTLFELGSISKVFTGLILADMVDKGEVSLDDPAAKYLPAGHRMPALNGRQITLRDLATHTSGLPRMADDMPPANGIENPFADYGEAKLLAFLDRYQLTRNVGSKWEYSNLGFGLLGYLLGRAAHSDYETLLRERIAGPLHMNDTKVALARREALRLAPPFDRYMRPAKRWDIGLFAGAGGIHSSAADMLIFAHAALDAHSPIAAAMRTALSVRAQAAPQVEEALGWEVLHPAPGREVVLHDGQTGGFQSIMTLEPAKGRAVIALANSQAQPDPTDLALHILIGSPPLPTPPLQPAPPPPAKLTEISLPTKALDKFVGRYDFGNGFVIAITHDGPTLSALREGFPGAQPAAIYPEGPLAFFWKVVDAQIRFTTDPKGAVTGAEFRQGTVQLIGKRL